MLLIVVALDGIQHKLELIQVLLSHILVPVTPRNAAHSDGCVSIQVNPSVSISYKQQDLNPHLLTSHEVSGEKVEPLKVLQYCCVEYSIHFPEGRQHDP